MNNKSNQKKAPAKKAAASNDTKVSVKRQLEIPKSTYYDIVDENTRIKRDGAKENTEETMIALMEDGLKYRKQKAA